MSNSAPTASLSLADLAQMVQEAERRIHNYVIETPLDPVPDILPDHSSHIFFKLENLQQTGSFKLRGATNKILSLDREQAAKGVIAASNGNHGLGVAAASRRAGIAAEVYVSAHVSPSKARRIEEYGVGIRRVGKTRWKQNWLLGHLPPSKAKYLSLHTMIWRSWLARALLPLSYAGGSHGLMRSLWPSEAEG